LGIKSLYTITYTIKIGENVKKTTPEKLEKDVGFTVDFKKLYKR